VNPETFQDIAGQDEILKAGIEVVEENLRLLFPAFTAEFPASPSRRQHQISGREPESIPPAGVGWYCRADCFCLANV